MYFFYVGKKIVATNGFVKKTQKTPAKELKLAKERRADWGELNPVTRSVSSGKTYNRKKEKQRIGKEFRIYNGQSERENKNTRAAESIFFCKRIPVMLSVRL